MDELDAAQTDPGIEMFESIYLNIDPRITTF